MCGSFRFAHFSPALALVCILALAGSASPQVISQSGLTPADVDPEFQLTLDHLGQDLRWLGLAPRQVSWSPDGTSIYFRWREDPEPGQHPDTDPWYVTDARGRRARRLNDEEAALIPAPNIRYSGERKVAAWSSGGMLFLWTPDGGTRVVFSGAQNLSNLSISWDGSQVFFSTQGQRGFSEQITQESGDLWAYDVGTGGVRQIAVVTTKVAEPSEQDEWLGEQQLELLEIVAKRKRDRETADSVRRVALTGQPQRISIEKDALAYNLQLSPDGRFVTFQWIKDPRHDHRTSYMEFVNEDGQATERTARPKVGEPLASYKMGIVRVDATVDPDSVEVTWVDAGTEKDVVVHGPYWNPQGTKAVVQILSMDHKDRWISVLDVETGETEVIDHQHEDTWIGGPLVEGRWSAGFLQWLPDGEAFGFGSTASGWAMLYLGSVDGTVQQLTDGEWEVRRVQLSPGGKIWYLETSREHPGEEHLYHLPARGGELERVTTGEGMVQAYYSPNGRRLAITYETQRSLPDLYVMENKPGASMRQVTKSGTDPFYRYDWTSSEIITFSDPNGLPTWAEVWTTPEQHNGAAVIYVHGCGECGQGVTKGWRRVRTKLYANYLRQLGYVAANFDFRGSSGYGHANRTYAYRQMGVSDVNSILPFLDILATDYGVDASRIGIYGGSYGGFFTLMALFRLPGKFAAGVALYPVTDWAHYNQGYTSRILNGSQLDDEEAYRVSSPIYYADGLQDALMIQHGLVDGNVQIQDSFRLAEVLIELGKDFDLVVYPVEDHGWDEVPSRIDSYKRMTRWFNRYLLEEGSTRPVSTRGEP
jgi:dipeptidyl aminopeptidase/acylaminoacyl peptidase